MTDAKLSDALMSKIASKLEKLPEPTIYWDYRETISVEEIQKAVDSNPECPLNHFDDVISSSCSDMVYNLGIDKLEAGLRELLPDIQMELKSDDINLRSLAGNLRDDFLEYLMVNYNLPALLKEPVDIRITMYSTYDCINSHWLESYSPYSMDSYFGDMVRQLRLNPCQVKTMLRSKGLQTVGRWPSRSDGAALVSYEHFWQELQNTSCGANNLTFLGKINAYKLLEKNLFAKGTRITIPAGNLCGIFSSFQGGGSLMEMTLLRDFKFEIGKAYDKSQYLQYGIVLDDVDRYSIKDVYGCSSSVFGQNLSFE